MVLKSQTPGVGTLAHPLLAHDLGQGSYLLKAQFFSSMGKELLPPMELNYNNDYMIGNRYFLQGIRYLKNVP